MSVLVILLVLALVSMAFSVVLRVFALRGLQCRRYFSVPAAY